MSQLKALAAFENVSSASSTSSFLKLSLQWKYFLEITQEILSKLRKAFWMKQHANPSSNGKCTQATHLLWLHPQCTYLNLSLGKHTQMKSLAYCHLDKEPKWGVKLFSPSSHIAVLWSRVPWCIYLAWVNPSLETQGLSQSPHLVTFLPLVFTPRANPVSRFTEFQLSESSLFFGVQPSPTRWAATSVSSQPPAQMLFLEIFFDLLHLCTLSLCIICIHMSR